MSFCVIYFMSEVPKVPEVLPVEPGITALSPKTKIRPSEKLRSAMPDSNFCNYPKFPKLDSVFSNALDLDFIKTSMPKLDFDLINY